jgi:hypothetical protein
VSDTSPQARSSRRDFIAHLGAGASATWLATIWPAAIADAASARAAAQGQAPRYRALTAQQAADFGAVADRIIPPDDTPGARDVGVVFFADHLLASFAPDQKPAFDKALTEVNAEARKRVPGAASFAALTTAQQDETLHAVEDQDTDTFNVLRAVVVSGYFSHPSHGGNRNLAGWKAIGFEDRMEWAPPFGYYDRPEVMAWLLPPRRA